MEFSIKKCQLSKFFGFRQWVGSNHGQPGAALEIMLLILEILHCKVSFQCRSDVSLYPTSSGCAKRVLLKCHTLGWQPRNVHESTTKT